MAAVHPHTPVLDGVLSETRPGHLTFRPAPLPSDENVAHVIATVGDRVARRLARRHLEPADDTAPADPLADGTSHLLFEPIELLEKLTAIIPRPAVNLTMYHGVLAPHPRSRSHVVRSGRPAPDVHSGEREPCPRCGGRLRLIAPVQDPAVLDKILAHLGLLHPAAAGPRSPSRRRIPPAPPRSESGL